VENCARVVLCEKITTEVFFRWQSIVILAKKVPNWDVLCYVIEAQHEKVAYNQA